MTEFLEDTPSKHCYIYVIYLCFMLYLCYIKTKQNVRNNIYKYINIIYINIIDKLLINCNVIINITCNIIYYIIVTS